MYHLQVITPEKVIFDGNVSSLVAPGKNGYLGILKDHAPFLTTLQPGLLTLTAIDEKKTYYKISCGFLEVKNNNVVIIVDTIEATTHKDIGIEEAI